MSRITSEANALGTFGYNYVDDVSGSSKGTTRLASVSYPNSQVTNFAWYGNTGDQRLQQIQNLNPSGATLSQFNYQYDSAGQITQWQQQQNANNLFYNLGYDQAGQLISASAGSGGPVSPPADEFHYAYDSAANRTSVQQAQMQTVRVGGTKTTSDVLTITVNDPALSGGTEAVNYTVMSGDTLASITAALATAINTDTNLQSLGVIANAHGSNTFINIRSASTNLTTYALSTSGGATETLTAGIFKNGLENLTIGGSKTTSDVLTVKVTDPALGGGSESVTYTVLSGDTLNSIAAGVKSAINADTALSTLGVTATSAQAVVSITSNSINVTAYSTSLSGGATETMALSVNPNPTMLAQIGGSKTTSDVLTLNFYDSGLAGGTQAISYTVLSGDNLTSIATALTSAINGNSALSNQGISATSSGTVITITSNSPNATTYVPSYSGSATESILLGVPTYGWQVAALGGSKTTGDVVSISFFDAGLSGGNTTVSYTALSGDTLSTICSGLASAINGTSSLSNLGISASASSTVLSLESTSPNMTTYAQSTSSGATETIALGKGMGVQQASFNNVNELLSLSAGGAANVQGLSTKPLASAITQGQVVAISSTPPSSSSVSAVASKTPTESISIANITPVSWWVNGPVFLGTITGTATTGDILSVTISDVRLPNGSETVSYEVQPGDSIYSMASELSTLLNADGPLIALGYGFGAGSNQFSVEARDSDTYSANSIVVSSSIFGLGTETSTLAQNTDNNTTVTLGGSATAGDVVSVTVVNANLPNGQETDSYTVAGGNTLSNIAAGLASAINADSNLAAIGVGASSSSAVLTVSTDTSYTASTSGGATESISVGTSYRGNVQVTLGGKPTTSDTVTITVQNPSLSGGSKAETYTVLSTDSMASIGAGLAALINADSAMKTLGVSVNNAAQLASTESFSGNAIVPSGSSVAQGAGVDGSSNTATNPAQVNVQGGTGASLTFDANGNMLTDQNGNSYGWDACDRLIQGTYPGTNNYSTLAYDALGRNVSIVETTAGSVTSTKNFVWCNSKRREQRDAGSSVTAQFFRQGETISSTKYFYGNDHLSSVCEMTDNSGTLQAEYSFDPFGRTTKIRESVPSDFGFAGYYVHGRSGLYLTRTRAYNGLTGRFINRDITQEVGGVNLYSYVNNSPIDWVDPSGERPYGVYHKVDPKEVTSDCLTAGPIETAIGRYLATEANDAAAHSGLPGGVGGPQDAYRHCLWSCMMAKAIGADKAKSIGDCHEQSGDDVGQKPEDAAMDTANNGQGREAAKCPDDCKDSCMNKLNSGDLVGRGGVIPIKDMFGPGY